MEEEFSYQTIEKYNQDLVNYFIAINKNFYQTIQDPSMIAIRNKLINSVIKQEKILPPQQQYRINSILNTNPNKTQNQKKKYRPKTKKEREKINEIKPLLFSEIDHESGPKKTSLNLRFYKNKTRKQDNLTLNDIDADMVVPNSPRDNQNDLYIGKYQNTFTPQNFQNYPIDSFNGGNSFTAFDFYNIIIEEDKSSSACHENDIKNIEKFIEKNDFITGETDYITEEFDFMTDEKFDINKFRVSMLIFSFFPTIDPKNFLTNRYYLILISIIVFISTKYEEIINKVEDVNSNFMLQYNRDLKDGNCKFSSALLYLYLIDSNILKNMVLNTFDEICDILDEFKRYELKNDTIKQIRENIPYIPPQLIIPLISVLLHKGHFNFYDSVNQIAYDHLRQIIVFTKLSMDNYERADPSQDDIINFKNYPIIPEGYRRKLNIFSKYTGFQPKRQIFNTTKEFKDKNYEKSIYKINDVEFESYIIDRDGNTNLSEHQRYNTINGSAFQIVLSPTDERKYGHVITLKPINKNYCLLIDPNFFTGNKLSNYNKKELKITQSFYVNTMRFTFSMELLKSMYFALYGYVKNDYFKLCEYLCQLSFIHIDDNKISNNPISIFSIICSYKSEYSKRICKKCSRTQTKFNCRDMTKQEYINKPNLETYIKLYDEANINRFYTLGCSQRIGLQKEGNRGWCKIDYWEHKLINYEKESPIILICINPSNQYLYLGDHLWYDQNSKKCVFLTIYTDKKFDGNDQIRLGEIHELTLNPTDNDYSGFFELSDDFDIIINKFTEWGYFLNDMNTINNMRILLEELNPNGDNDILEIPLEIPLETQDNDMNTEESSEYVLGAKLFGSCSYIIGKFNSFVLTYFREIIISFIILIFIIILIIVLIKKRNNRIYADN